MKNKLFVFFLVNFFIILIVLFSNFFYKNKKIILKEKTEKFNEERKNNSLNEEPANTETLENENEKKNNIIARIEMNGDETIYINKNEQYIELGARAYDSENNDITDEIVIDNSDVNIDKKGEYYVVYSIGKNIVVRNVIVK